MATPGSLAIGPRARHLHDGIFFDDIRSDVDAATDRSQLLLHRLVKRVTFLDFRRLLVQNRLSQLVVSPRGGLMRRYP
jgi:hypothetical protein